MNPEGAPHASGGHDAVREASEKRARRARLVLAAASAVLVAIVWWRFVRTPGPAPDPFAAWTPTQAEEIAVQRTVADDYVGSLPWFRRGTQGDGSLDWTRHYNLAYILGRVSTLNQPRSGIDLPMARSSIERVELAHECERAFGRANELAPNDAARATIEQEFAQFQYTWGRMWEADRLLRAASRHAPGDAKLAAQSEQFLLMLQDRAPARAGKPAR